MGSCQHRGNDMNHPNSGKVYIAAQCHVIHVPVPRFYIVYNTMVASNVLQACQFDRIVSNISARTSTAPAGLKP